MSMHTPEFKPTSVAASPLIGVIATSLLSHKSKNQ